MNKVTVILKNLSAGHNRKPVVYDVNLVIREGERIALLGANGSGKSTLLKCMMGLVNTLSGSFCLNDIPLNGKQIVERYHAGVRLMVQGGAVFSTLSVRDNMLIASHAVREEDLMQIPEKDTKLYEIIRQNWTRSAGALSAGQRQVLAVCMFLQTFNNAKLLLADEPTANLSPDLAFETLNILSKTAPPQAPILIVEQNKEIVLDWASRILWIDQGKISESTNVIRQVNNKTKEPCHE